NQEEHDEGSEPEERERDYDVGPWIQHAADEDPPAAREGVQVVDLRVVPAPEVPRVVRHVRAEMDARRPEEAEEEEAGVERSADLPRGQGADEDGDDRGDQERRPQGLEPEAAHGDRGRRGEGAGLPHETDLLAVPDPRRPGEA